MDAAGPSTPEYIATPSGATKRPRNVEVWSKVKAKQLRNLGLTYTSRNTHREVPAQQVGEPCQCINKCFDIIGMDNIQDLFRDFWALGDYNLQNAFMQKQVDVCSTQRRGTQFPHTMRNKKKEK